VSTRKKTPDLLPATGDPRDAPHVSRAEAGCRCPQCATHRLEERRAERDRRQIEAAENDPMTGAVQFGANATDEFRNSLNGGQQ
jgi:hypothetical protein